MSEENNCDFVSSRGILHSCGMHSKPVCSSISRFGEIERGIAEERKDNATSLYICITSLPFFASAVLPKITGKFILVSGDGDESVSANIGFIAQQILNSGKVVKWYSQNLLSFDPRIEPLPIGLDYHTMKAGDGSWGPKTSCLNQETTLKKALYGAKHFSERKLKCYVNYHKEVIDRNSRKFYKNERIESLDKIEKKLIHFENMNETRENCWKTMTDCAFVLSPPGGGWDCHRTWEALCLGCIPIVKRSGMRIDALFDELPVLLVDKWVEVNEELLIKTIEKFSKETFNMEKLKLKYWIDKIHN